MVLSISIDYIDYRLILTLFACLTSMNCMDSVGCERKHRIFSVLRLKSQYQKLITVRVIEIQIQQPHAHTETLIVLLLLLLSVSPSLPVISASSMFKILIMIYCVYSKHFISRWNISSLVKDIRAEVFINNDHVFISQMCVCVCVSLLLFSSSVAFGGCNAFRITHLLS